MVDFNVVNFITIGLMMAVFIMLIRYGFKLAGKDSIV